MTNLKSLEAVATLCLLTNNIEYGINQFSAVGVMALCPVISGTGLAKYEVVWSENLTVWPRPNTVHGSWFQIHQHRAGHVTTPAGLIEVDIDSFQLQIGITMVCSSWINAMFIAYHLPELGADLVAALPALDVKDFSHIAGLVTTVQAT